MLVRIRRARKIQPNRKRRTLALSQMQNYTAGQKDGTESASSSFAIRSSPPLIRALSHIPLFFESECFNFRASFGVYRYVSRTSRLRGLFYFLSLYTVLSRPPRCLGFDGCCARLF